MTPALSKGIERRTFLERLATGGLVLAVSPAGVRQFNAITELEAETLADPYR